MTGLGRQHDHWSTGGGGQSPRTIHVSHTSASKEHRRKTPASIAAAVELCSLHPTTHHQTTTSLFLFSSFSPKIVSDHYKFRLILALQGLFSRLRYHLVMSMCLEFLYLTSFFFNHATKRNSLFFFFFLMHNLLFCPPSHDSFSGWPHTPFEVALHHCCCTFH